MAPQAWNVGEKGDDLQGPKEFLPLSKLEELLQSYCTVACWLLLPPEPCAALLLAGHAVPPLLQAWPPMRFLDLEQADIGVLYWQLDPKKSESEEKLAKIRKERGYSYMDLIEICPDKLENYEEKLKNFFTEHMHADEEIRYCLEGSGYFDVRDKDDKWIRIWIKEGDMIILPAGIYHRFTLDSANYVKLMRLFIGEPVWTALNRPQEGHPARQEYVKNVMGNTGFALAAH